MPIENKVIEIAEEISACKFRYNYSVQEYTWLAGKCRELVTLLTENKADLALINKLSTISHELEWQKQQPMHDLLMQQTLIFNQDAILFYLMKEGYLRMLKF
jgi:hypothetical protein